MTETEKLAHAELSIVLGELQYPVSGSESYIERIMDKLQNDLAYRVAFTDALLAKQESAKKKTYTTKEMLEYAAIRRCTSIAAKSWMGVLRGRL